MDVNTVYKSCFNQLRLDGCDSFFDFGMQHQVCWEPGEVDVEIFLQTCCHYPGLSWCNCFSSFGRRRKVCCGLVGKTSKELVTGLLPSSRAGLT